MCACGSNFGLSALCEMTGLGAVGLIQAFEQYLAPQGVTGGVQDLSSVCNYCTVAFSNLLKRNNLNCNFFPSIAECSTKEKVSVQCYY